MDQNQFDKIMDELMSEFQNSDMSVDDFVKNKLKAHGRSDADQCAEDIISTINTIDEKYASLQAHKAKGGNREEWLRSEMDEILKDVPPGDAGQLLTSVSKGMTASAEDRAVNDSPEYSGFDAPFLIRELDDAIVKSTCDNLTEGEV